MGGTRPAVPGLRLRGWVPRYLSYYLAVAQSASWRRKTTEDNKVTRSVATSISIILFDTILINKSIHHHIHLDNLSA